MRIVALLTDGFGGTGGIARYNQNFLAALAQSSSVARIIVLPRFAARATIDGKIEHLDPLPGRLAWSLRALRLAIKEKPDIIFCGHIYAAPLAAALARVTSAKLWLQVHGVEAWERPNRHIIDAAARANLITAVSRYTRWRLLGWSDINPARVRVLPNTLPSGYAPPSRRFDVATRWGLEGKKTILTVGRLASDERYKGHDRIIAALPLVAARVPSIVYLIVGCGDDSARLRRLAIEMGVEDRVIFAGRVPQNELADYFSIADVFAMPSRGEGFGIVFLEAAASGLPVIGGNSDGSVDPLADGTIGMLVDPEDRGALAIAIVDGLEGRLVANAGCVERFAFSRFADHLHVLVQSLI